MINLCLLFGTLNSSVLAKNFLLEKQIAYTLIPIIILVQCPKCFVFCLIDSNNILCRYSTFHLRSVCHRPCSQFTLSLICSTSSGSILRYQLIVHFLILRYSVQARPKLLLDFFVTSVICSILFEYYVDIRLQD